MALHPYYTLTRAEQSAFRDRMTAEQRSTIAGIVSRGRRMGRDPRIIMTMVSQELYNMGLSTTSPSTPPSKPAANTRTLRFIGGPSHGKTQIVPLSQQAVEVQDQSSTRRVTGGVFGSQFTTRTTVRYERRSVTLRSVDQTAIYTEEVLLAPGVSLREAEILLLDLGLRAMARPSSTFADIEVTDSSMIGKIGYSPTDRRLRVTIKNSDGTESVYEYSNVDASVFAEFLVAESKGRFFNSRVKAIYASRRAE